MEFFTDGRYGDKLNARPQRQGRQAQNAEWDREEVLARTYEMSNWEKNAQQNKIRPNFTEGQTTDPAVFSIQSDELVVKRLRPAVETTEGEDDMYRDDVQLELSSKYVKVTSSINGLTWVHPDPEMTQEKFYKLDEEEQKFWARRDWTVAGISDTKNERGPQGEDERQGKSMLAISIQGIKQLCQNQGFIEAGNWTILNAPSLKEKRKWPVHGIEKRKQQWVIEQYDPKKVITWDSFKYHLRFLFAMGTRNLGADNMDAFFGIQAAVGAPALEAIRRPNGRTRPDTLRDFVEGAVFGATVAGANIPDDHIPLLAFRNDVSDDLLENRLMFHYGDPNNEKKDKDAARDLVRALRCSDEYYCPARFAGQWLKLRLMKNVVSIAKTENELQFTSWANVKDMLEATAKNLMSEVFRKQVQKEIHIYFSAYAEVSRRVVGRALTSNGEGKKVIIQMGKGPI